MALCVCAIVIGQWIQSDDIIERFPRVIKVSLFDPFLDPAYSSS